MTHEGYKPGTVLDPFGGAGTTGLVAATHFRRAVLAELNPEYCEIASKRITAAMPLFNQTNEGDSNAD